MSICNDNSAFLNAFADGDIDDAFASIDVASLLTLPLDRDVDDTFDQPSMMNFFKSSKSGASFSHEDDMELLRGYTERGALDGVIARRFKNHKLPALRQRLDELVKELVKERLEKSPQFNPSPSPGTPPPEMQLDTQTADEFMEPITNSHSRNRDEDLTLSPLILVASPVVLRACKKTIKKDCFSKPINFKFSLQNTLFEDRRTLSSLFKTINAKMAFSHAKKISTRVKKQTSLYCDETIA